MKSGAPWKLKGRGPEGREIARAAARRSGTSVGEWLNRVIAAADDEDEAQPPPRDVDHEPPTAAVAARFSLPGSAQWPRFGREPERR